MLVPYEMDPVPEVTVPEAHEYLHDMRHGGLVAFVLRNVAPDGAAAYDLLAPSFSLNGYRRVENRPILFRGNENNGLFPGRGWHADGQIVDETARVISVHYTSTGRVDARFAESTESAAQKYASGNFPPEFYAQLGQGLIDDSEFDPLLHAADGLGPKDAVVFRLHSTVAEGHCFTTREVPRNSTAINYILV